MTINSSIPAIEIGGQRFDLNSVQPVELDEPIESLQLPPFECELSFHWGPGISLPQPQTFDVLYGGEYWFSTSMRFEKCFITKFDMGSVSFQAGEKIDLTDYSFAAKALRFFWCIRWLRWLTALVGKWIERRRLDATQPTD